MEFSDVSDEQLEQIKTYCQNNKEFSGFLSSEIVFNFLCNFIQEENIENFDLHTCIEGVYLYVSRFQPSISREDFKTYINFVNESVDFSLNVLNLLYVFIYLHDSYIESLLLILCIRITSNNNSNFLKESELISLVYSSYEKTPLLLKPLYKVNDYNILHKTSEYQIEWEKIKYDQRIFLYLKSFGVSNYYKNLIVKNLILNAPELLYLFHPIDDYDIESEDEDYSKFLTFLNMKNNFFRECNFKVFAYFYIPFLRQDLHEDFIKYHLNFYEDEINLIVSLSKYVNPVFYKKLKSLGYNEKQNIHGSGNHKTVFIYFMFKNKLDELLEYIKFYNINYVEPLREFCFLYTFSSIDFNNELINFTFRYIDLTYSFYEVTDYDIEDGIFLYYCKNLSENQGKLNIDEYFNELTFYEIDVVKHFFKSSNEKNIIRNKLKNLKRIYELLHTLNDLNDYNLFKEFFDLINNAFNNIEEIIGVDNSTRSKYLYVGLFIESDFVSFLGKSKEEIKSLFDEYLEENPPMFQEDFEKINERFVSQYGERIEQNFGMPYPQLKINGDTNLNYFHSHNYESRKIVFAMLRDDFIFSSNYIKKTTLSERDLILGYLEQYIINKSKKQKINILFKQILIERPSTNKIFLKIIEEYDIDFYFDYLRENQRKEFIQKIYYLNLPKNYIKKKESKITSTLFFSRLCEPNFSDETLKQLHPVYINFLYNNYPDYRNRIENLRSEEIY